MRVKSLRLAYLWRVALIALLAWVVVAADVGRVLAVAGSAGVERAPAFVSEWGGHGSGNGQFDNPTGVAVDSAGNVFVADRFNNRVEKFASNGAFITKWGRVGGNNGQFAYPGAVAVDAAGNVYVADGNNARIQKFTSSGTYLTQWGIPQVGGGLTLPSGVAVGASGRVYVSAFAAVPDDETMSPAGQGDGQAGVLVFSRAGAFIDRWSTSGRSSGGIAVDSAGSVYVSDFTNDRIQKFTPSGVLLTEWGSHGSGPSQFSGVSGLAVNRSGTVFVADRWNNRVQMFTSAGAFLGMWGVRGSSEGQFSYPFDVATGAGGRVYVADSGNDRIQRFRAGTARFANWVAVGDSYSSGEGSPPFDVDTDGTRCHRSSMAWPRLLGTRHHLACTGSTIDGIYGSQRDALVALNQNDTVDAVTVTIGGNDSGFADVLGNCFLSPRCSDPLINNRIDGVAQRLADINGSGVYHDIETAAPSAQVIVVGYPRLFPADYANVGPSCRPVTVGPNASFSRSEVTLLNAAADHLDRRLREAAGRAGVAYVSTLNALDGHELCTGDPWVRPVNATCAPLPLLGSTLCAHPWERTGDRPKHGQRSIADLVQSAEPRL